MAITSSDLILKSFLEFCLYSIRQSPWQLADIIDRPMLEKDPLLKQAEGKTEYQNFYDWFTSNEIPVLTVMRKDRPSVPCITVTLGSKSEIVGRASLGDTLGTDDIDPTDLDRPMVRIYNTFSAVGYDPITGTVTMPSNLTTYYIAPLMHMLVDASTGKGYEIKKILTDSQFTIAANTQLDTKELYIVPVTKAWVAERGRARFKENYELGIFVNSEPMYAIWLSQIVQYMLLKYKFQYLEERGLMLSTFGVSDISRNESYQGDNVYSRFINMNFETEHDWIQEVAPRVGKVAGGILISDGPKTPDDLWQNNVKDQFWKMAGDKDRK